MATLVLTVVGGLIGGPIGAAIGAVVGQQVDREIFKPKGRDGPRLGDLAVQTSSYGAPIPRLFGRVRVSGTVIWATDLREDRRRTSSGKGRPSQTVYSYSANFAVALSARPAGRIGRIWADGKLLRGEAGDFKTATQFRFYTGGEDQLPDPLIASVEGTAPAHRGLAYAVFEDFQLAEYGNRIPSISFEVIADEAGTTVGTIIETLAPGADASGCVTPLVGFIANGGSIRGVLETIGEVLPLYLGDDGAQLRFDEAPRTGQIIAALDAGASASADKRLRTEIRRAPLSTVPRAISLTYFDVARDFQPGLQRVFREGGGKLDEQLDLAASLTAANAEWLMTRTMANRWAARVGGQVSLPWRYLGAIVGSKISVPDLPGGWTVRSAALESMTLRLLLHRDFDIPNVVGAADPGRATSQPDALHGPTVLQLLDLPPLTETLATVPQVFAAAAGPSSAWRSAAVQFTTDGGATWRETSGTVAPATIGTVIGTLAPGSAVLADRKATFDVELLNEAMHLSPADMQSLLAGANLALVGEELLQFAEATPLSATRFRCAGLLRGRRGTEWAIATHVAGERFVLIEQDSLLPLDVAMGVSHVLVQAIGVGDDSAVEAERDTIGHALRPPAPVMLKTRDSGGDTSIGWIRRSRIGWAWLDGTDAPLGEEAERYRVTLQPSAGSARVVEVTTPHLVYTAVERASDIAGGAIALAIDVVQLGTLAQSYPTSLILPLV